jgi:hypothetical protein
MWTSVGMAVLELEQDAPAAIDVSAPCRRKPGRCHNRPALDRMVRARISPAETPLLTRTPLLNPQIRRRKRTRPPAGPPPICTRHDLDCPRPHQTPRAPPARPGAGTHLPMDRSRALLRRAERARSLLVSRARAARLPAALPRTRRIAFPRRLVYETPRNESRRLRSGGPTVGEALCSESNRCAESCFGRLFRPVSIPTNSAPRLPKPGGFVSGVAQGFRYAVGVGSIMEDYRTLPPCRFAVDKGPYR